jgi:uncharacterized membrane protein
MAEKYSFIVVKYPKADTGEAALAAVLGLAKEKVVKLRDAVAITKTPEGKLKLHQTKDDTAKKGFLKGGGIGVLFALLFGPVGWIAAGAALGTAFALFDRGIKDKLLKELGEKMTPEQSALAVLVEDADWETLRSRMATHNFQGEVVVQELVADHLAAVEKLVDAPTTSEAVPEEVKLEAAPPEACRLRTSRNAPVEASEKPQRWTPCRTSRLRRARAKLNLHRKSRSRWLHHERVVSF